MKRANRSREQHPSNLLTREENDIVFSLFGQRCESLATTVVQVFSTSGPEHSEWSKLDVGVLCLIKDHLKRSYYFRLYCPDRRVMLWEHEVYNSMGYNTPKPFFHTFEAQDCIIAFNFASEEEAGWLQCRLLDKLEYKKQRRERKTRNSYHPRDKPRHKPSYMTNGVSPAEKYLPQPIHMPAPVEIPSDMKDEKKKSKKKDDKKLRLTKTDIGNPTGFRHISHVGWDANKGFNGNLGNEESPEMKQFFLQAGVSESQLEDKATRDFIYDFIHHNGGIDRVVNEVSQVAPDYDKKGQDNNSHGVPRSGRNGGSRPPPLPTRNSPSVVNRAAPPPPPSRTVPAPPPPTQTPPPPPPPPLRTMPQQPVATGGPPPPPPPPLPAAILAPAPPPLPTSTAPELPQSDTHSALMESIRLGTNLRKVDVDSESKNSDSRGELLTQIRQGISLRPVQPMEKSAPAGPPENSLADALARALAERSRFIHSESSTSSEDEEDDDDEWED